MRVGNWPYHLGLVAIKEIHSLIFGCGLACNRGMNVFPSHGPGLEGGIHGRALLAAHPQPQG